MSQTSASLTRTTLGMTEHVSRPRLLCKALPTTPNPSQRIGLTPLRAVATISPPSPRALTTVEHVEAQHPEFVHVDDLDSEMAAAFAQYQRATSAIATAAERSSQLEAMLGDIDKLQAELDESLLVSCACQNVGVCVCVCSRVWGQRFSGQWLLLLGPRPILLHSTLCF